MHRLTGRLSDLERVGLERLRVDLTRMVQKTAGKGERLLVTSWGRPAALLVPVSDYWRIMDGGPENQSE